MLLREKKKSLKRIAQKKPKPTKNLPQNSLSCSFSARTLAFLIVSRS
jgi:hypothetical protein